MSWRCRWHATTSACSTATQGRTPAAWAPTARSRTCRTTQIPALLETFHRPILAELARRGTPFRGALYAGLMLTEDGPVLLECNARFGDPETQVLLPRLAVALGPLLLAAARGELAGAARALGIADWRLPAFPGATVAIVLASGGYPDAPRPGGVDLRSRRRRGRRCARLPRRHRHRPGWHRRHRRRTGPRGRRSRPGSRGGPGAGRGGRRRHHVRRRPAAARHRSDSRGRCRGVRGVPMIRRYTLAEMGAIWSETARFEAMLRVELAVARAQAARGLVPADALTAIETRSRVDVDRIAEIEKTTDHDVIAFVSQVAETVGPEGRYLHLGLTSSDVVDTGLALQLRAAGERLLADCDRLTTAIIGACPRRGRDRDDGSHPLGPRRADDARAQARGLGLRGRTGPDAPRRGRRRDRDRARSPDRSGRTATSRRTSRPRSSPRWGSMSIRSARRSSSATGTRRCSARSRSSAVRWSASRPRSATSSTPRSASSRSRSRPGRRARRRCPTSATRSCRSGSPGWPACFAAMPAPRSRTSRSGTSATSAIRAPSGSSCPTRPRSLDYMLVRMTGLVEGLVVRSERMRENIARGLGLHASSRVLVALVESGGLSREDAYAIVQRASLRAADERAPLRDLLAVDPAVAEKLTARPARRVLRRGRVPPACADGDQAPRPPERRARGAWHDPHAYGA